MTLRDDIHGAAQLVHDLLGETVRDLANQTNTLTEDEAVVRYLGMHRGNPRAIVDHATRAKLAGRLPGQDPLTAAATYEKDMEKATRKRVRTKPARRK